MPKATLNTPWYADDVRAKELADRHELTIEDFIELTGIGAGDYGIYRVMDAGVVLRAAVDANRDWWSTDQQVQLNRAAAALKLAFPCTPAELLAWHERTRGANGAPSDFPLSDAFVRSVRRQLEGNDHSSAPAVPSHDIVRAFAVRENAADNKAWWDRLMREAKKRGFAHARRARGRGRAPSLWNPLLVADYLISRDLLTKGAALRALEEQFPDIDRDVLES